MNTSPQPKSPNHRIVYLNATALKALACEDRFALTCVQGWRERAENPIFAVGKAVHKYAEEKGKGTDELDALTLASRTPGVPAKLSVVNACANMTGAGLTPVASINGIPLVEYRFCIPFSEHLIDGITYELYLVGRFDRIGVTRLGVEITDYKSTRKWDFGDVVKAYADDVQFLFYYTVARRFAYDVFAGDPSMAEMAWQGKLFTRLCAIMLSAKPCAKWQLGPLWSPSEDLYNEFLEGLRARIVPHVISLYAKKVILRKEGLYKNLCPGCHLSDLCLRENPLAYERQDYNPLLW